MTNAIFITGTDTGVGKTVVTGLLARFFTEKKVKTITQKWLETGSIETPSDIFTHTKFLDKKHIKGYQADMVPYTFKFPSSPHLAASLEEEAIVVGRIENSFRRLTKDFDLVLIEGTGGTLVPISDEKLIIDIVKGLKLPVLIVAENRLGAINQTLLTVEALKKRNLEILGVIFNRISDGGDELILKDNIRIVEKLSGVNIFGELAFSEDTEALYQKFLPIGEEIFSSRHCEARAKS